MSSKPTNTPILSTTKLSNKLIIPSSQHIVLAPILADKTDENKCLKTTLLLPQNVMKSDNKLQEQTKKEKLPFLVNIFVH